MGKTSIGWCDWSLNPIRARSAEGAVGHYCEKLSAGCKNCYASRLQSRFRMPEFAEQRREGVDLFLDPKVLDQAIRRKKPTRIFWCDMSDIFGAWVPDEWIDQIFAAMALSPQHTHLVLTKRPERMRAYLSAEGRGEVIGRAVMGRGAWVHQPPLRLTRPKVVDELTSTGDALTVDLPLPNVHVGISVEDQATAEARIPLLLDTPAALRWVSLEPALGPVDFTRIGKWRDEPLSALEEIVGAVERPRLDWAVIGFESGARARPGDVAWIRSFIDQFRAQRLPAFVKQLGARPFAVEGSPSAEAWVPNGRDGVGVMDDCGGIHLRHRAGADPSEWPEALRVREFPR